MEFPNFKKYTLSEMKESICPASTGTSFKLKMAPEIVNPMWLYGGKFIVLTNPRKIWYKRLLEIITFGYYNSPITYKIKPINPFGECSNQNP